MVGDEEVRRLPRLFVDLDDERVEGIRGLFDWCYPGSSADPHTWWLWDIGPFLPQPLAVEAWTFARTIAKTYSRRALMACIVRSLPPEMRQEAVQETLELLADPPNDPTDRLKILAPLVTAGESDELTEACRRLLSELQPLYTSDPLDRLIDLLANLPAQLTELALDFGDRLLPGPRFELIRALASTIPTGRRDELIAELESQFPDGWGSEMVEHARALIALSTGTGNQQLSFAKVLDRMTRRNWWAVFRPAFIDLIPRLSQPTRQQAVATALQQFFTSYRTGDSADLIDILAPAEVILAFQNLPRVRDEHARAVLLAVLMRRASEFPTAIQALDETDIPAQIPENCTQSELFTIVAASAWWINRNCGIESTAVVADALLSIVQRWR